MGLLKYCPIEAGNSSVSVYAMHIAEGAHFGLERYEFVSHGNIFLSWSIHVEIEHRSGNYRAIALSKFSDSNSLRVIV